MKKQRLALVLASLWMVGGIAHAEDLANPGWYVVPQIGAVVPDANLKTGNALFAGVKLGKQLSEHLDVQIGGTISSKADVDYPDLYKGGDYSQSTLSLETLYVFSRGKLRPFVSAGIGVAFDKFNYQGQTAANDGSATKTSLLGSFGAGLQYALSRDAFVQGDVRYMIAKPEYDNGAAINVNKTANVYAGLGIGFHFGAAPEALPAPVVEEAPAPLVNVPGLNVCEDTGSCVQKPVEEKKPVVVAPVEEKKPVVVVAKPVLNITLKSDASFASGSSVLTAKGKRSVDKAVVDAGLTYGRLAAADGLQLQVVGHASRTGSETFNQKISLARAEAVKAYLVSKGVPAAAIATEGRGSSQPVSKPEDCAKLKGKQLADCLSIDRRVELTGSAKSVPAAAPVVEAPKKAAAPKKAKKKAAKK